MKYCANCGKSMEDDARFCMQCGKQAVVVEEQAPVAEQKAPSPAKKPKKIDVKVILLLAIIVALAAVVVVLAVSKRETKVDVPTQQPFTTMFTTTQPESTTSQSIVTSGETTTMEYTAQNNYFITSDNTLAGLHNFGTSDFSGLGTNYKTYWFMDGKYSEGHIVDSGIIDMSLDDVICCFDSLGSMGKIGFIYSSMFFEHDEPLAENKLGLLGVAHFGKDVVGIDKDLNSDITYEEMQKTYNVSAQQSEYSGLYVVQFPYRSNIIHFAFDHMPSANDSAEICWLTNS